MTNTYNFKYLSEQFFLDGKYASCAPLGAGHINDSYLLKTEGSSPNYVLQRINHNIFKNIEGLQSNIIRVTAHIAKKLQNRGVLHIENRVLRLVQSKHNTLCYYQDTEGNYWRLLYFIPDCVSYDNITPKSAELAGEAFGDFQLTLADIQGEPLVETIPNFHNMEFRLQQFREALTQNAAGRIDKVKPLIEEIENRAQIMCTPEELHRQGKLPKRINHCDTKVNNILFNRQGEVLCVVDLDTVMPGYVLSDFGDFMRTGANTGAEDDPILEHISINLSVFEAYTKGYMRHAKHFLTPIEISNLAFGAKLLTYMQTVRFFTDYLNGDTYYKIQHSTHNLQRTHAQLKLLKSMEENFSKMENIVANCL